MLRVIIAFSVLISSLSAFATDGDEPWAKADWLRSTFFSKAISDTIYTPDFETTIPPIHVIRQSIGNNPSAQADQLVERIFFSLGFNGQVKSPTRTDSRVTTGVNNQLPAHFYERMGTEGNDKFIYCAALIKEGKRLHAIYFKTFQDVEATCAHGLLSLSKSKALYQ